ncbi:MAG: hypothetical protein AB1715_01685, partial [Acidobacteriota bacterium]
MTELRVSVKCPYCKKSLMDDEMPVDGCPSVKVKIQFRNKSGILRLSSIYGSYNVSSEVHVP